ncbi:MAG TPA: ectoine/hydroxyectoine ABC transporter permease subunit EhuC [Woeseiaceae bacterium]|nr:ectoine/hydroxyectoine ABC transporter permease subunit EhuC [Woeseiaceae bacterium]
MTLEDAVAFLQTHLPALIEGLRVTLQLTVGGAALALMLSLAAGLGRRSPHGWLRWPANLYVEVFRGTSALVQLFWFYFALPFFGVSLPALVTGVVVLGLNSGAYGAEVVRSAIANVPPGQWEAARALNLSNRQVMRRVILPQALPMMLPPAGNLLIELLKNTALVSLITLSELTFTAQVQRAATLETVPLFALTLLIYFGIAQILLTGMRRLERNVTRHRGTSA